MSERLPAPDGPSRGTSAAQATSRDSVSRVLASGVPGFRHPPPHPLWPMLQQTRLAIGARGAIRAALAPSVLELADRPMIISGFLAPLDNAASYRHFLLSRYSPVCPCCPPGGLSDVIEVVADRPVAPTPAMVVMSGLFSVQCDMARGRFYHLTEARLEDVGGDLGLLR
jgi:hypothetical protein